MNKHFTLKNKQLLVAAVSRIMEMKWKCAWSSGGKIYVWRDDGSDVMKIDSVDEVQKMTQ